MSPRTDLHSFNRLAIHLSFALDAFIDELSRLRAADFPTATAFSFIDDLKAAAEQQRADVQVILGDFAFDPAGALARLKSEHRKAWARLGQLSALQNAQTRKVPWSLEPTIERLGKTLIPDSQLLACSVDRYSYEITWWKAKSSPGGQSAPIRGMLFLPSLHRLNALLHVIIGHELFHPLHDEFLDAMQPDVVARLKNSLASLPVGGRLDQALERARTIWRRALEELICDMGAAALFGPAAVSAIDAFLLPYEPDQVPEDPEFYPPDRYRLRQVVRYAFDSQGGQKAMDDLIDELVTRPQFTSLGTAVRDYWKGLRQFVADTPDETALDADPLTRAAYTEVQATLADAWRFVRLKVEPNALLWTTTSGEVAWHLENLRSLVPSPGSANSEAGESTPASPSAVAIAAWFEEIFNRSSAGAPATSVTDYQRSCRLLFKSIEDAEVIRAYPSPTRLMP